MSGVRTLSGAKATKVESSSLTNNTTDLITQEYLKKILNELKILNLQLASISGDEFTTNDFIDGDS